MLSALPAASTAQNASGYLYELLRALGVSVSVARHVQDLLLRPLTILVILLLAALAAHLGSSIIRRSLRSLRARATAKAEDRAEEEAQAGHPTRFGTVLGRIDMFGRIAANLWRVVVWVVAVLSIIGVLGINLAPFVAGATVLGATIGFGAQSLVKDYLSGFLLLAEDQYRIGDDVVTTSATGVVEEMTLRVTRLRGDDGTTWHVPNGDIRTLGNTSRRSASLYVDVLVPLAAPIDRTLQLIEEAATEAVEPPEIAASCLAPPRVLGVEDLTTDGLTVRIALSTKPGTGAPIARAVRAAVVSRLVQERVLGA